MKNQKYVGPTKKMVIRKGNGQRVETDITMYWSRSLQGYVTIPEGK